MTPLLSSPTYDLVPLSFFPFLPLKVHLLEAPLTQRIPIYLYISIVVSHSPTRVRSHFLACSQYLLCGRQHVTRLSQNQRTLLSILKAWWGVFIFVEELPCSTFPPSKFRPLKMCAATFKTSLLDLDIEGLNTLLDSGASTSVELVKVNGLPFIRQPIC